MSPATPSPLDPALQVLVVEDDPDVRLGCEQALQLEGFATVGCASAEEALKRLAPDYPGIVVSDIRLPGMDGMALLARIRTIDAGLPVVLITGHGDVRLAVQAMKDGAHDFIEKPFAPEYLVEIVRRAQEQRRLALEVRRLRARLEARDDVTARIVGASPAIARVRELIVRLAASAADVLILGETGTGKELVARCLHDASARRDGNFVAVNCGGLPDNLFDSEMFGHEAGAFTGAGKRRIGKIEHAAGGTLFLDEIESMPLAMQIKLLRVLQERMLERLGSNTSIAVDCRVVAATKADLKQLAAEGKFRADLYYRLNVATLPLPPLRERREDIPLLFEHFLLQAAARHQCPQPPADPARLRSLLAWDWPGNVRELKNAADRCALGLDLALNESGDPATPSLAAAVDAYEKALIADTLRRHDGNLSRSAEALQVAKTTLFDKVKKHNLGGDNSG